MALAFSESCRADYLEVIEFLLRRYHSLSAFEKMSFKEFAMFYAVAIEQDNKEKNYLAWVELYPHMTKENYISFEAFHEQATGKNIDRRTNEEIVSEVEAIRKQFKERR